MDVVEADQEVFGVAEENAGDRRSWEPMTRYGDLLQDRSKDGES